MSLRFKKLLASPFYLILSAFLFIFLGAPINSFAVQVKLTLESYAPARFPKISKVIDVSNPNNQVEIAKQAARFAHSSEGWNLQGFGGDVQDRYPPDWTGRFSFVHKISTSAKNLFGYPWDEESTRYGGGYALYFHTDENCFRSGHSICETPNNYGVISGGLDGAYSRCAVSNWGRFKVEQVEDVKIPLGEKDFSCTDRDKTYRIYIPSRYGGTLIVSTDAGVIELFYPNPSTKIGGPATKIDYSVPLDKHGWYYVKYSGTEFCKISNTFVEEGQASYRPWNFWYYPFERRNPPSEHPDWKLNLYTEDGALDKYDAVFGTKAREYEEKKYSSGEDWWGHCWGGSIASILVPQPQSGQSFNQEEVEGLVTKLANARADRITLVENIPSIHLVNGQKVPLKPQPGTDETDEYAGKFHTGLLEYLRLEKRPLQTNLRDPYGRNEKAEAIWHHSIYKYASTMKESDEGKEDVIKITTTIFANADIFPSDDNTIDRKETYVYKLKYKSDGKIDEDFVDKGQDWISATHFAPAWLWFIKGSLFDGKSKLYNPEVKKRNVEKLGVYFP